MKISFFISLLFIFNVFASDETVLIKAKRDDLPIYAHSISSTIYAEEELNQYPAKSLKEFLEEEVSFSFAAAGAPGQTHSTFSRGSEARHTVILIDGIKMNDPSSPSESFNLYDLDLSQIKRIEIFHGAQSVLYGSGAVGGVINIITKDGQNIKDNSSNISIGAGNYKTSHGVISTSGIKDEFNYFFLAGMKQSESVSSANEKRHLTTTPDPYSRQNFSTKLQYEFNSEHSIVFSGHYFKRKSGIDSFVYLQGLQDDPYAYNTDEEIPFKISVLNTFFNDHLETNFHYFENRTKRKLVENSSYGKYFSKIKETKIENNLFITSKQNTGIDVGVEEEQGEMFTNYEDISLKKIETKYTDLHYQFDSSLFFLFSGGRLIHHQLFKDHVTYQINPGINILSINGKIKGGLSRSFKSPNLFQLYSPSYGNKNLKPEKGLSKEIIFEENWDNHHQSKFSYFNNNFYDLFDYDRQGTIPTTINISKAVIKGYEFKHKSELFKSHEIIFGLIYFNKIYNEYLRQDLLRRSKIKSNLILKFLKNQKTSYSLSIDYYGTKNDINEKNQTVKMPSYFLCNASINHKINKESNLNFSVQNILDKDYEEVYGYGTLGRNYYLSLSHEF